MRMAFGLVGILGTIAVIVWIMHAIYFPDVQASLAAKQKADTFVNQLNGQDENGVPIEQMYAVYADMRPDGKLQDLQITNVAPGSALQQRFGLMKDDVVTAAIDSHMVRTDLNGLDDEAAGKEAIREAYTGDGGQLVVIRNDQTLTLPLTKSQIAAMTPAPAPTPPPANVTAQNQPAAAPTAQQQQTAQKTEQQQEGKSNDGSQTGTMDEIHQRLHALPTY